MEAALLTSSRALYLLETALSRVAVTFQIIVLSRDLDVTKLLLEHIHVVLAHFKIEPQTPQALTLYAALRTCQTFRNCVAHLSVRPTSETEIRHYLSNAEVLLQCSTATTKPIN